MKFARLPLYYCWLVVASAAAAILPDNQELLSTVVQSSVNQNVPDDELDPAKKRLLLSSDSGGSISHKSSKSNKGKGGMSGGKGKGGNGKGGKGKGGKGKGGKGKGGKGKGGKGKGGKGKGGATGTDASLKPTPVTPLPLKEQNNLVTCVSVIDENSDKPVDADWLAFRALYPDRPFCLLQPRPNPDGNLSIPATFDKDKANIYANVTREERDVDPATRSDWFTICKLADSRARGLTNVVLFVDNSISLGTANVQNAHDAFLADVAAAGMEVVNADYMDHEDYIGPCSGTSVEVFSIPIDR